jgi:two-component system, NtrC family, response regulator AtoC
MLAVRQRAEKFGRTNVPVLIEGEGGTGKEVLAQWIHRHSPWCNGQFVKVNCAAIPGGLLESELFGYQRGAFTWANSTKPGKVELADKGTLFLDEIADLDYCLQSKLLQFLQDGRFSRIGDVEERTVETRLICATNKDLEPEVESGRFRADLYYRINVVRLKLPRLCQRREDIPALAEFFRSQFQRKFVKEADPFDKELIRDLQKQDWPGNIRELSNSIARHVLLGEDSKIVQDPAAREPRSSSGNHCELGAVSLRQIAKEAIRDQERNYILEALQANRWNRRKTAEALQISYRALIYKIRNAGIMFRHAGSTASPEADTGGSSGRSAD